MQCRLWVLLIFLLKALEGTGLLQPSHKPCVVRRVTSTIEVAARDHNDGGPQKRRVNHRVNEIMELVESYNKEEVWATPKDWSKTRKYVHSRSDLTVNQVKEVIHFLRKTFPEEEHIMISVIQSTPRILRRDVKSFLEPTADFLVDLYGLDLFYEAVRRNPSILLSRGVGYKFTEDTDAIENLFKSSFGLKKPAVEKLKRKAPWLFQRPLARINEVVNFWKEILREANKDPNEIKSVIGKLVISYPTLFNLSVDKNLRPRIKFLEEYCGLNRSDTASLLIGSRASIFSLSVDDNMKPTIDFLLQLLWQREENEKIDQIRKCIVNHPQLMGLSLKNLDSKKSYFDAIDDLDSNQRMEALACRIIIRSPSIYSLNLRNNIIPTIELLAKVWGRKPPTVRWTAADMLILDQECVTEEVLTGASGVGSLASLLGEYPTILGLSLEGNIQPTLTFYNKTGYIKLDSHWNSILDLADKDTVGLGHLQTDIVPVIRGRYIAASLFQRLLPRWHYFLVNEERLRGENKDNTNGNNHEMFKSLPLHILAIASDKAYCDHLWADIEDYKLFKEDAIPRLKFSSQFDTWLKTGRPIDVQ